MALKTILFLGLFVTCSLGALFIPLLGVCGYVSHYSIGPEAQWWSAGTRGWGIRYSYTLALCTGIGIALNWRSLRYGKRLLERHEVLLLVFLGIIWLSTLIGEPTVGRFTMGADHPSLKMTKILLFALMMTHVATTRKRLEALLWVLVICALVLGLQAYDTPRRAFRTGRLETVGGPDFRECNMLAAYLAAMLPLIGVQFMKSKWLGKGICLVSGAFVVNAVVLTRSRGAFVGLLVGMVAAVILAPRKFRIGILAAVIVAAVGAYSLMDEPFIERASTIHVEEGRRDSSSESRVEIWKGSARMLAAHPFGVGAGNFYQTIGDYAPKYPGADAHNIFVRCSSELGIQGIAVFLILIGNAVLMLWRAIRGARGLPEDLQPYVTYTAYGILLSLITLLACGLTVTLLYMEGLWWIFVLPVCMVRVVENLKAEAGERTVAEASDGKVRAPLPALTQGNEVG